MRHPRKHATVAGLVLVFACAVASDAGAGTPPERGNRMTAVAGPAVEALELPTFDPDGTLRPLLGTPKARTDRSAGVLSAEPDISRDGHPDLITLPSTNGGPLTVRLGTGGTGGNGAFTSSQIIGSRGAKRWLGQGDLDADGDPDVMTIDNAGNLHYAKHTGTFAGTSTLGPETLITTGWGTAQIPALADFLGPSSGQLDRRAELIFRFSGDNSIYVYRNTGTNANGTPLFSNAGTLFSNTQAVTGIAFADLSGDDFPEIYMTFTDGYVRIYNVFAEIGRNGQFYGKWYTPEVTPAAATERRLLLDVNGDGLPDLVRRQADGALVAQRHAGRFDPAHTALLHAADTETVLVPTFGTRTLIG